MIERALDSTTETFEEDTEDTVYVNTETHEFDYKSHKNSWEEIRIRNLRY